MDRAKDFPVESNEGNFEHAAYTADCRKIIGVEFGEKQGSSRNIHWEIHRFWEHVTVQKEDRAKCLIRRRGRNTFFSGKTGKGCLYLALFGRV